MSEVDRMTPCGGCDHPLGLHILTMMDTQMCAAAGDCECSCYLRPDGEMWTIENAAEETFGVQGGPTVLLNVHPRTACAGEHCVLHNPSDHALRDAPLNWRGDRNLMERTCPHGIGHPDPDSVAYLETVGIEGAGVHGCDGCCR